jgi:hypothetical protein
VSDAQDLASGDLAELDKALSRFLDSSTPDEEIVRLREFGPAALERVLDLCFRGARHGVPPLRPVPIVKGRDAVDAWSSAIAGLGGAFPDEFLDSVQRMGLAFGKVDLTVVTTLAGIDRPRAEALLSDFAESSDYLIRYHSLRGLGWRDSETSHAAVGRHITDPSPLVRMQAIRGVARHDPFRAIPLLEAMVADGSTPPLLRNEAKALLDKLRAKLHGA